MSILLLIVDVLFILDRVSSFIPIIDSEINDVNLLIPCPINRTRWSLPSIVQWSRLIDNYSKPLASQFDNYPVHIDDSYRNKYDLLSNGSLNIAQVQLNDNDTFECRLILIDRGLLDIKEKYFITHRVNERPRFLDLSNSLQIVSHYTTVNFRCQIYGVPVPTVKWFRIVSDTRQFSDDDQLELLATQTETLSLFNVDDHVAGKYRCVAKNRLGSIENDFQLFIRGSIYWRRFPSSQTVKINQSVILKCEGESSEPLQYYWLKNDLPLSETSFSQDRIRTFSDGILTIYHVQPTDHGAYVCVISTTQGASVRSKPAQITVKYPPIPSRSRQTKNLTLIRGSPGHCPCLLDAYPPIESVSWYRNGMAIRITPKGGAYSVNSDYSLIIRTVEIDDNGEYFCRAQNSEGFGEDSLPFYVTTKEPIKFIIKPDVLYNVNEGERLVLPCMAFGSPQPTIKWFKDSNLIDGVHGNLTLKPIEKTNHGTYTCEATNEHTTTNMTTQVIVENTTPQAPHHLRYQQVAKKLLLSWDAGYDGGRAQYFVIWYRNMEHKKRHWNQIRVLPMNTTEFLLFDLRLKQTYELTIVAENELGLGTFSPILQIQLNETDDSPSIGYLRQNNESQVFRPLSPTDLRLSYSGSNLYISWKHPDRIESSIGIVHYVIQWRSTILFNNQHSHQSVIVDYPIRSHVLNEIKQSNYVIRIFSYSDRGTYSIPIESQINIRFQSIFAYSGSNRLLILLLASLIIMTIFSIFLCLFCVFKYYYYRRTYCTDLECDSKRLCACFPRIRYRLGDCSHLKTERCRASLLKSNDLPTTPLYLPQHRLISSTPVAPIRPSSPQDSITDSIVSLAKVTTIPRCRESIVSNTITPSSTFIHPINEEKSMGTFFDNDSVDLETRKNGVRLPLEAVPEMSELDVANSRYSFDPTSSPIISHSHRSHSVQASPVLITFDSSSLKRRH